MAYVDGLLTTGEIVLRRERQHWILPFYMAGRWVAIAFAVFVASFLLNWLLIPSGGGGFLGAVAGFVSFVVTLITVVSLLIALVGLGWAVARWRSQEYVLTNQRVIHVRGVIGKQSSDSVLETIGDASIEVPFLGELMGWGTLVLMTANDAGTERMEAVRDPVGFKKAVLEAKADRTRALNAAAAPAAPAPAAPAPAAVPQASAPRPSAAKSEDATRALAALATLRNSGAITPEEYEAKKKELLDRI